MKAKARLLWAAVAGYPPLRRPSRLCASLRPLRGARRTRAFLELLVETGCDIIDAVLFEKEALETPEISGETVYVFRLADQTGILSLRRGGKQVEVFMATLISRHELSG